MEQFNFPDGADVEIKAVPDPDWDFDHWGGALSGNNNPEVIKMDGDKTVLGTFLEIPPPPPPPPPPPVNRILTLDKIGLGSFEVNEITTPPPPNGQHCGKIWTVADAEITIDDIFGFDWQGVERGSVVMITGAYNQTWSRPTGLDGLTILMKDLVFDGGGTAGKAWDLRNSHDVGFHSVDGNFNNAIFRNFDGKIIDQHVGTNMVFDGFNLSTPTSAGQTDGFYLQSIRNITVCNSRIIINNNNSSAHCDFIQLWLSDGDLTVRNVFGRQNNNKTKNAQGIFAEYNFSGSNVGNFVVRDCDFVVGEGGIVLRNKDSVRRGIADVRNNKVYAKNTAANAHAIWMNFAVSSNSDIKDKDVNDITKQDEPNKGRPSTGGITVN